MSFGARRGAGIVGLSRAVPGRTALGTAVLVAMLTACAGGPPPADRREMQTNSDQTDASRRAGVRLQLASAYFAEGRTTVALDELKQALQVDPSLSEAWNLRGLIYASLADDTLAEESFQRAMQLAPRDGEILHNVAWFRCQRQRYDEADLLFARAIEQPQYQHAQRTLLAQGVCQARGGRLDAAERTLLRAFEMNPGNGAVSVNLSEVLFRRGDLDRARFYIRRVNSIAEQSNAQTLWLAARIEQKAGNRAPLEDFGRQLQNRFPNSREAVAYEQGRFDE